jgi:thiol-disulfide isomerase/thioredoxin
MRKILIVFFLLIFSSLITFSQRINIGDQIPHLIFDSLVGLRSERFQISDSNNRFLILDFWSTACSSCIVGISKLDSIENVFKNEISIVPINDQGLTRSEVKNFWNRNRLLRNSGRWSIVDNSMWFKNNIPRNGVPFYIFIDKKGIYRGSGDYSVLNDNLIRQFLDDDNFFYTSGPPTVFYQLGDIYMSDDIKWRALSNNLGDFKLGKYFDPFKPETIEVKQNSTQSKTFHFINRSVGEIYKYCLKLLAQSGSNFSFQTKFPDTLLYFNNQTSVMLEREWNLKYRICATFKFRINEKDDVCAIEILRIIENSVFKF